MSLDPERLRREIEDEKGRGNWTEVTEESGAVFNSEFGKNYWERNKNNPDARDPHPPYDEGAPSYTGRVGQGGRTFIRVFPKDGSGPGRWLMAPD